MSYINILLKGNLSDILYQTSVAIIVSHITKKTLHVSIDDIDVDIQPILKYIKKSKINCQNTLYDKNITGDNIEEFIPKVKKNLELVGSFKNRNYFKSYKSILIDYYNLETEKHYSNSKYLYIDSSFESKKDNYISLINKIVNNVNNLEIIIDSKKYDNIKMGLERIYSGNGKINIVENVDYKKLCVMANCGKGGYYTGEELGWWGSFLNRNESIEIKESEKIEERVLPKYNKSDFDQIYKNINVKKPLFMYYSKTPYNLLFQRPQQICRFMSNEYTKVFICKEDNIITYDEKYQLFIVSYLHKDLFLNIFEKFEEKIIYYTDSRLLDDILKVKNKNTNTKLLYDLIDNPIEEFSVWKPNLERCVNLSDFVIYSHPNLLTILKEINKEKDYQYISNACDYEHFSKAKERIGVRPVDFPETDKKILGYYGAFAEWLDYELIKKYADEGEYHIVMIGGITNCASYNIRFEHPNITWLDHKPYDILPYYLSWFDVCFLPFRDCEVTKCVNPCKLWEYMACEKDIIKTNVDIKNEEIIKYEDVVNNIYNILNLSEVAVRTIINYNIKS